MVFGTVINDIHNNETAHPHGISRKGWTGKLKSNLQWPKVATLTMRNRFLGVQISLIWVVFAVKTVILL